jgi:hypothetical protein
MTGGKAYYNTNDLATSFKRAADDASSYYLLGYYLPRNSRMLNRFVMQLWVRWGQVRSPVVWLAV